MSHTHVANSAMVAVVLSFGLAGSPAWAEEYQPGKGPETSPTPAAAPEAAPGVVRPGFPVMPGMPGMYPGMAYRPYGMPAVPRVPRVPVGAGPAGMPYGPFAGRGAGPMMPTAPAMPARPDIDESVQERQKQIDERLGAFDPGTPSRREYFKQRRQERKRQFDERYAAGMPMGQGMPGMPSGPSATSPWGAPTAPAVPNRDSMDEAVDQRVREVDAASRGMYPWGQARRDWYQARRQYKKDMWQRQFEAARAHSPGMMPHQPWGMMGPGARAANPWAPAPGEE